MITHCALLPRCPISSTYVRSCSRVTSAMGRPNRLATCSAIRTYCFCVLLAYPACARSRPNSMMLSSTVASFDVACRGHTETKATTGHVTGRDLALSARTAAAKRLRPRKASISETDAMVGARGAPVGFVIRRGTLRAPVGELFRAALREPASDGKRDVWDANEGVRQRDREPLDPDPERLDRDPFVVGVHLERD